jgi:phage baseplate assembly protein W
MNQDFYGRGWSFPVRPGDDGRLALVGGEKKIRQSIWLILGTAPGERQMRPVFGCGIHDLVFHPITAALRGLIREHVLEALGRWEPRIEVVDVRVEQPLERLNQLNILIDYRVLTHNAVYNLVYPFFINEGAG